MEKIEREPVEIIIRRGAFDAEFTVTSIGIEPHTRGSVVPQNVAELKHTLRGYYDALEVQEALRAKLVLGLRDVLQNSDLPDAVLEPAREELARWNEPAVEPTPTTE